MPPREDTVHPLPPELLSATWERTHGDQEFLFGSSDAQYLEALAIALDDDLASLLVLKKIQLADVVDRGSVPGDVVTMNSFLEFEFAGKEHPRCHLAHPSARARGTALRADTRLGLGVLGLRSGQMILWPDQRGIFRNLTVRRVVRSASLASRLDADGGRQPPPPAVA